MDFGGTIKSYAETYGNGKCPEIVNEKFKALDVVLTTEDIREFYQAYYFLIGKKKPEYTRKTRWLFDLVRKPIKFERRAK